MSTLTIQEQFNDYISLLSEVHDIDQQLEEQINEVEIFNLREKRMYRKNRLKLLKAQLIESLSKLGTRYPIHNYLASKTTYIWVEDKKLQIAYY
ncbi:hypothetical protein [Pedobacter sp. Leaf170]|uniref:hypothetical protein n=1 Tax=Pedobacter sp. Leaf170 TaxID=2876558 RepID=UPI001E310A27|nr:hypothetical protein [Pedobacter sp. Leaf170]